MPTTFGVGASGVDLAGAAAFGGSGASQAVLQRARFDRVEKLAKELADTFKDADKGTQVAVAGLIEKMQQAALPPPPPPPSGSQRRLDTAVAETAATLPDLNVRNAFTEDGFQITPDAVNRSPFNTLVDQNTLRGLDPKTNANLRNTPEDIATELIAVGKGSAGRFDSQINLPESLTKVTQQSLGVKSLAGVAPLVPVAAPPRPVPAPAAPTQRAKAVQVAQAFRQQPKKFTQSQQAALIKLGAALGDFQGVLDIVSPGGGGFDPDSPEGKFLNDIRQLERAGDLAGVEALKADREKRLASKSDSRSKLGKLQDRRNKAEVELDEEKVEENPDLKKIERLERDIKEATAAITKEGGSADSGVGLTATGKNLKRINDLRQSLEGATDAEKLLINADIKTLQDEITLDQAAKSPNIERKVKAVQAALKRRKEVFAEFGEKSPEGIEAGNFARLMLEEFNRSQNEVFASIGPDGQIFYAQGPGAADKVLEQKVGRRIEPFQNAVREFATAMSLARDSRTWYGAFGAGGFTKKIINFFAAPFNAIPFDDITNFNIIIDNIRASLNSAIRSNPDRRALRDEFNRIMTQLPDAGEFTTNKQLATKRLGKSLVTILSRMASITGGRDLPEDERIQIGLSLGLDIRQIAAMVVDPDPTIRLDHNVALDLIETFYPNQATQFVDLLEFAQTGKKKQ